MDEEHLKWLAPDRVLIPHGTPEDSRPWTTSRLKEVLIAALRDPDIRQALREALDRSPPATEGMSHRRQRSREA